MQKKRPHTTIMTKGASVAAAVFLAPAIAMILLYMIYPIIDTFLTSQYDWNGISPNRIFVGLENWSALLKDSAFWSAFQHNLVVMAFSILLQIPIGLMLATFLDATGRRSNLFKVIWFFPYLMSSVAIAFLFSYILATNGGLFSTLNPCWRESGWWLTCWGKTPPPSLL